jgi:NDP-sugar pyrophosphorylase family protein
MHAIILAGGQGTRLRPLTNTRPKPLLPFMGEPFAVGMLRRLVAVGATRATFLVGRDPVPFEALIGLGPALGLSIDVVSEETPLDTAGAARRRFAAGLDGPALVCNGDILTDLHYALLMDAHVRGGATATIALTRVEDTSTFGVVVCDTAWRVRRFVEKPARGTLDADTVNAGTYVLSPDAFERFPGDGPLSFERQVFPGLVEAGEVVLGVAEEAYWQDLGTPQRYLAGHRDVLEGRCHWPVAPGLRAVGELAMVDASAEVDPSARLGPGVVVGAGCRVGADVELDGAVLHDHVRVERGAVVRESVLGPRVTVGARAVVGPGAVLADDAAVEPGQRLDGW